MPNFYEFFAGAGLARLGLEPRWACLWANDISEKKARVYARNFSRDHLIVGDVAAVDPYSLPPGADLAWASFPCQDLSLAGWRTGMQARRSGTFWAFWRLMADLHDRGSRPNIVAIENVVGLLSGDNLAGLCEALAALDMAFGALVIDAKHFLPQSRPRVFIIAVDATLPVEAFIYDAPPQSPWAPGSLLRAYAGLPDRLKSLWRWWKLPTPAPHNTTVADLLEDMPIDDARWRSDDETRRLLGMMTDTNMAKVRAVDAERGPAVGTLYRRIRNNVQRAEVRFDGTAGCLRTPVGGSSRQTVMLVEPDGRVRSRLMTPREAARLMGAPDTFWLPANYNDAYLAMGDAVASPVVSWLAEHLLTPIAEAAHLSHQYEDALASRDRLSLHRERAELLAAQWELVRR